MAKKQQLQLMEALRGVSVATKQQEHGPGVQEHFSSQEAVFAASRSAPVAKRLQKPPGSQNGTSELQLERPRGAPWCPTRAPAGPNGASAELERWQSHGIVGDPIGALGIQLERRRNQMQDQWAQK